MKYILRRKMKMTLKFSYSLSWAHYTDNTCYPHIHFSMLFSYKIQLVLLKSTIEGKIKTSWQFCNIHVNSLVFKKHPSMHGVERMFRIRAGIYTKNKFRFKFSWTCFDHNSLHYFHFVLLCYYYTM